MGPTYAELRKAESYLRQDDKALRLRYSLEQPYTILVERKTFVGRVGSTSRAGFACLPDAVYRRESGLLPVCSIPSSQFHVQSFREALQAADTWRKDRPLWRRVEEADAVDEQGKTAEQRAKRQRRQDYLRYKSSELFDEYVWRAKSRISTHVP